MEDEYHFLNICPAYQETRSSFLDYLEKEYRIKISRMSPNRIFMFLINPPSGTVRILITCRAKLLNADWLRQRAFFLNQEGTFANQEGMIT